MMMNLCDVELSVLKVLNDHAVEYLVIGGCAMRFFGMEDREIADVDLFINRSQVNVQKILDVLLDLREKSNLPVEDLEKPYKCLRMVHHGLQFDIFTSFEGVDFLEAYNRSVAGEEQEVPIRVIAVADLLTIKKRALEKAISRVKKEKRDIEFLETWLLAS
jgi:predicted nucleotidyltransferase